ncbi:MAG: hypothetical protein K2K77_06490, partial [Duncaniella sp.]|nr:hypothetical protein [Duncaniella sp.]
MEQVKNTLYKMLESQLVSGMILPVIAGINSDCAVVSFDLAKISTLLIGGDRFTGVGTYVSTLI